MIAAQDHPTAAAVRSFRDPGGVLIRRDGRILRILNPEGAASLAAFLQTTTAREAAETGKLVRSTRLDAAEFPELDATALIEHERIPFPSYPYEWPPEMLHAAGALTLELAKSVLDEGFGLKDASPYNVLFRGSEPVFVDVLSFERRDPLDPSWNAYAQLVRTFLLPLLAWREFGLSPDQVLMARRDGLEPETMYRWAGFRRRWKFRFMALVSLPKWMSRRQDAAVYRARQASSAEQAAFILKGLLNSCRRHLDALRPGQAVSKWSDYTEAKSLYSDAEFAEKEAFVTDALGLARHGNVLDVGANEGHFSFLAAASGARVVAIDSDPAVSGAIWRKAHAGRLDVLPLVVDLTRPTPATGWRNQECESFLDRSRGGFDLVLMLAVIHHMLVTERVPLEDLLDLVSEISKEYALIEYVAPEDPMFQRIVRGREALYSHLTRDRFEAAAARRFDLVRSTRIGGLHRWLYLFRRRRATA
jgi:2-polyprenyl-3-methyl-5-hydroxy-6-metoxy-1,4-benzoquinol methylase